MEIEFYKNLVDFFREKLKEKDSILKEIKTKIITDDVFERIETDKTCDEYILTIYEHLKEAININLDDLSWNELFNLDVENSYLANEQGQVDSAVVEALFSGFQESIKKELLDEYCKNRDFITKKQTEKISLQIFEKFNSHSKKIENNLRALFPKIVEKSKAKHQLV